MDEQKHGGEKRSAGMSELRSDGGGWKPLPPEGINQFAS